MPHPTDESKASTLPDPELNPLLNPLLAAHMGRWAEVYFTNPPEKRGQAIAELLRELENISRPDAATVQVFNAEPAAVRDERVEEKTETAEVLHSSPSAVEPLNICGACGHNNSAEQRFCGMCGGRLEIAPQAHPAEAPLQVAESAPISGASWSEPEPPLGGNSVEYAIEPTVASPAANGPHAAPEPAWPPPERSFPSFGVESAPVPHRYRLYVVVALAIFLVALLYMAWRGTKAPSGSPQSAPSTAILPAQPAPAAPQQPSATPSESGGNPPVAPKQSKTQPDKTSRKNQDADSQPASRLVTKAASSSAMAAEQSGAEELATAEKYLNGTQGMTRDSAEAALWLWKAVGKGNVAATLALSDLYLRGDGVPKSCDQARLLLDAAARKGGRAAADRLRNLQAFGCE